MTKITINSEIFNRLHLAHNINKNISSTIKQFCRYVIDDLINRLSLLDNNFKNILLIGLKDRYLPDIIERYWPDADITVTTLHSQLNLPKKFKCYVLDEEQITLKFFTTQQFDLVIYSCGLQFVNNPVKFLSQISTSLSPKGIIIANFIGGRSLQKLRKYMLDLEEQFSNNTYTPHIIPFIRFDDVPILLKHAGFNEVIVDYEDITLQYDSALALMRSIKESGYGNILNKRANYAISKKMLDAIKQDNHIFKDEVQLITFTATLNRGTLSTGYTN